MRRSALVCREMASRRMAYSYAGVTTLSIEIRAPLRASMGLPTVRTICTSTRV